MSALSATFRVLVAALSSAGAFVWVAPSAAAPVERVKIHAVQGSGAAVTGPGPFEVDAIVTASFQARTALKGFFIQEEDADADANLTTSEALFVYCERCPVKVTVGDRVRVTGRAKEFFGMSQLSAKRMQAVRVLSRANPLPAPVGVTLPFRADTPALAAAARHQAFEAREGMLVRFDQKLTVTGVGNLARFGEIKLSARGRLFKLGHLFEPSAESAHHHRDANASRTIVLDDGTNRFLGGTVRRGKVRPALPVPHPPPGYGTGRRVRAGDHYEGLTGVLHWSWNGGIRASAWRVRPVPGRFDYQPKRLVSSPAAPARTPATIRVVSLNAHNYFATLAAPGAKCGPRRAKCRGANSIAEFKQQTAKLVNTLCRLDADIVGLTELENDQGGALATLVEALNASCPNYSPVRTGTIGYDVIKAGMLYKANVVTPVGPPAILDAHDFVDPLGRGRGLNRPALSQRYEVVGGGLHFALVVNHLKSKLPGCGPGDAQALAGAGACNRTRTLGARALVRWLGKGRQLVVGDLNSYRLEEPMIALKQAGYVDLLDRELSAQAYSYVHRGEAGYLDHALASAELLPFVTRVHVWHVNADESALLDYNDDKLDAGEAAEQVKPPGLGRWRPLALRASDHDPVVVDLAATPWSPTLEVKQR